MEDSSEKTANESMWRACEPLAVFRPVMLPRPEALSVTQRSHNVHNWGALFVELQQITSRNAILNPPLRTQQVASF